MMAATKIAISASTNQGFVRETNQDTIGFSNHILTGSDSGVVSDEVNLSSTAVLCVLADGLGGHAGGEIASRFAVEQLVARESSLTDAEKVIEEIENIHSELCWRNRIGPGPRSMGTTICGVAVTSRSCIWFNVGDSRVYSLNGRELVQLSIDDTSKSGETEPSMSGITQCLGGSDRQVSINVHVGEMRMSRPLLLFLASDGLTSYVEHREIVEAIRERSADYAVRELIEIAKLKGGLDNISVAIVDARLD